jgi:hypothetical protein
MPVLLKQALEFPLYPVESAAASSLIEAASQPTVTRLGPILPEREPEVKSGS